MSTKEKKKEACAYETCFNTVLAFSCSVSDSRHMKKKTSTVCRVFWRCFAVVFSPLSRLSISLNWAFGVYVWFTYFLYTALWSTDNLLCNISQIVFVCNWGKLKMRPHFMTHLTEFFIFKPFDLKDSPQMLEMRCLDKYKLCLCKKKNLYETTIL